jgi:hypothetical protein
MEQQTGIDSETISPSDQEQQPGREPMRRIENVPAVWAVPHGDGNWSLTWDLSGADRYQLVREGVEGEAPQFIAEGPDTASLKLPDIAEASRLRVVARMGNQAYAVSKVGTGEANAKADVSAHLREWKSWKELAPHDKDGATLLSTKTTSMDLFWNAVLIEQRWRATRTPQELMTFKPNLDDMFPGSIVQSRRAIENGQLTSAQIEDEERAPVDLVVSALGSGPSARVQPTYAATSNAIKRAVQGKTSTSSGIRFAMAEAHSSEQTALALSVSGKYGGFAASLDVSSDQKNNQSSIMVYLRQVAFTASVQIESPDALFSDRFTEARLTRLETLGTVGPHNPPLIVSDVMYGRILAFSITSEASESDLKAAADASYHGFVDIDAHVKAEHQATLSNSNIELVAQGGDTGALKVALGGGTLADYFDQQKDLSAFEPIGFVVKTLNDEIATMSESYEYTTEHYK